MGEGFGGCQTMPAAHRMPMNWKGVRGLASSATDGRCRRVSTDVTNCDHATARAADPLALRPTDERPATPPTPARNETGGRSPRRAVRPTISTRRSDSRNEAGGRSPRREVTPRHLTPLGRPVRFARGVGSIGAVRALIATEHIARTQAPQGLRAVVWSRRSAEPLATQFDSLRSAERASPRGTRTSSPTRHRQASRSRLDQPSDR